MQSSARERTAPSGETLRLEWFVPFRLAVLNHRMTARVSQACRADFNLSAPEWRMMAVLARYGPMTPKKMSDHTAMDKVRVSRATARLLARGYVTRATSDKDGRMRLLALTPKGQGIYHKIVPKILDLEQQLLADLNSRERILLDRILSKLEVAPLSRSEI